MAVTRRRIPHPPAAVYALLTDGFRYAEWVVGTKRVRTVEPDWPKPGTRFHHTIGVGPLATDDHTEVLAFEDGGQVVLKAHGWPTGAARVTISAEEAPGGGSDVVLEEVPIEGPAKRLHCAPLDALIHLRNIESLRRLEQALARRSG